MGVTPEGYDRDTYDEILDRVETKTRANLGAPNLDMRDPDGFIASIALPLVEEVAALHELAEIVYNVLDPERSTRQSFAAVGALRGVYQKPAAVGTHPGVTFTFDDAVPGPMIRGATRFHPEGQPENVWINSEAVVISGAGSYTIAIESEVAGASKVLNEGATIEIVSAPSQLTSIAIPSKAVSGTNLESEAAWRARTDAALNVERTRVEIEVEAVDGVVSASVIESPGYIQVIVNDNGGGADNDAIAAAILSAKAQGVVTLGGVTGDVGGVLVRFARDSTIPIYVLVRVRAPNGVSETDLKAAIIAQVPTQPGAVLVWGKLYAAAQGVQNVTDVPILYVGTTSTPTSAENLSSDPEARFTLDAGNITVEVVS